MSSLFDRRLLVVTGKGGVGKSTISAGLAVAAARRGKRVLVCEVNTKERISALLEHAPVGEEIGNLIENVDAVNVEPHSAMREYALMVLKFKSIYNAVFENRLVRYFLRAIPSLAELVMLGKILFHVKETLPDGRFRYDLIVLDAPATGHGITFLRVPQIVIDTVPSGPMADDARWMNAILMSPEKTAVVLVTLPEAMPVNETVELNRAVRDLLGMPRGAVILNGYVEPTFSPEEVERLRAAPSELAGAAHDALRRETRAELSVKYDAKLRVDIGLPQFTVPFLFTPRFGRAAVEEIARLLEKA